MDGAGLASLARLLGSPAAIVRSSGGAGSPGAGSPEAGPAAADSDGGEAVRRQLLAVEPGRRRRALLVRHCRELAARVLDGPGAGAPDAAAIDSSAPLAGLGFDSMRTLELRSRLELSLGVPLPATLGWQYPTLDALVPFLAERMGIPLEAAAVPASAPGAPHRPDVDLHDFHGSDLDLHGPEDPDGPEDLDGLSERELEALLLAKTEQFDTSADPTDRGQGR
ncbi:hypothetical protein VR45_36030 [Streptomyces sp. NRRL S-495]|nr:hypothetical protein VR45_36030 [Streptomyces sp. NRRL S-495]